MPASFVVSGRLDRSQALDLGPERAPFFGEPAQRLRDAGQRFLQRAQGAAGDILPVLGSRVPVLVHSFPPRPPGNVYPDCNTTETVSQRTLAAAGSRSSRGNGKGRVKSG